MNFLNKTRPSVPSCDRGEEFPYATVFETGRERLRYGTGVDLRAPSSGRPSSYQFSLVSVSGLSGTVLSGCRAGRRSGRSGDVDAKVPNYDGVTLFPRRTPIRPQLGFIESGFKEGSESGGEDLGFDPSRGYPICPLVS